MTTATKKPAKRQSSSTKSHDATTLLRADHKHVNDLFEEFEKARSPSRKQQLVTEICTELKVHAQVEEEIFYPAVKEALKDKDLVPEATVEHASLKALIAQIEDTEPEGEMFDARMKVLSEYVKHHVKEEQSEMFPKAKASNLDMDDLGARIAERKAELLSEMS